MSEKSESEAKSQTGARREEGSAAAASPTRARLRELARSAAHLPEDFDEHAHLALQLGLPSVAALELLVAIEDDFGIHLPDEEYVAAVSFDRLAKLVERLVDGAGAAG